MASLNFWPYCRPRSRGLPVISVSEEKEVCWAGPLPAALPGIGNPTAAVPQTAACCKNSRRVHDERMAFSWQTRFHRPYLLSKPNVCHRPEQPGPRLTRASLVVQLKSIASTVKPFLKPGC